MKTIRYQSKAYYCPLSTRFRRHTREEAEAMRASIAPPLGSIQYPVLLYDDTTINKPRCVLDGEGRLEIAADEGFTTVPFNHLGKLTTEEAYEIAKTVNDARRHDDPATIRQRRAERVERVAAKRAEGKSIRTIAEEEEVSKSQVERDLSTVPPGTVETPEKTVGKDGRARKSTRPKKPKAQKLSPGDPVIIATREEQAKRLDVAAGWLDVIEEVYFNLGREPAYQKSLYETFGVHELKWVKDERTGYLLTCIEIKRLRQFCTALAHAIRTIPVAKVGEGDLKAHAEAAEADKKAHRKEKWREVPA